MSHGGVVTIKDLVRDHVHTILYTEDWQWQPSLGVPRPGRYTLRRWQGGWPPRDVIRGHTEDYR